MKRMEFLFSILQKLEKLREENSKHRLCLEIYPKRSDYSIELRHYYKEGLKKWIILTNNILDDNKYQKQILNYLDELK